MKYNLTKLPNISQFKRGGDFLRSSQRRVVVTGLGLVTPIGNDVKSSWTNLINGMSGIQHLGAGYEKLPCRIGGCVDRSTLRGYRRLDGLHFLNDSGKFALLAATEAITDSGLDADMLNRGLNLGLMYANSFMDMSSVVKLNENWSEQFLKASSMYNLTIEVAPFSLGTYFNINGSIIVYNSCKTSGLIAIGRAFRVLQQKSQMNLMICTGSECPLSPFLVAAYAKADTLSTHYNDTPEKASRPFDRKRDGFVLAEGAGVVILEDLDHALKRNAPIYCELKGFAVSSNLVGNDDKFDMMQGLMKVMKETLADAGINKDSVSYINTHGASSIQRDAAEALAIQKFFGDRSWELYVSSTKGAHGNMLSASPVVETVFTILAINHGVIPPTLNVDLEDNEFHLNFVPNEAKEYYSQRKIALKLCTSMTGINTGLVMCPYVE